MLNNFRPRSPPNSRSDNKRNDPIRDSKIILLIPQTLNDKQWGSRFTDLKKQLEVEFAEMPRDIKISKAFATLRGLCLGPEVVMSLNAFERKYYNMEYHIKMRKKSSDSRSISCESMTDWAIKCILSGESSELSDVTNLDHTSGPESRRNQEKVNKTGYETSPKNEKIHRHSDPNNDLHGGSSSSPYSDSTVTGHERDRLYPRLALPKSSSTQCISPSSSGSPATLRLEAFSPMLSPVRENKAVECIWRDDSLYLAPLSYTPKESKLMLPLPPIPPLPLPKTPIKVRVSGLPSSNQKGSQARPLGMFGSADLPENPVLIRENRYIPLSNSNSSSIIRSHRNIGKDKVPLTPQTRSSPELKRESFAEICKSRCSSEPTSLINNPKHSRVTLFESSSKPSFNSTLPLSPTVAIRKNLPGLKTTDKNDKANRRSFGGLGSRTQTPAGRVPDEKNLRDKHQNMERGARSSDIPVKTSITITSESSAKTFTPYSQLAASTLPNSINTNRPGLSGLNGVISSGSKKSDECISRISITPSLPSSSTSRRGSFRPGGLYDKRFFRENSTTSTILSTATNSTGDIPKLVLGISSDSSVRRVARIPRLIEVTKNTHESDSPVPLERANTKQPRIFSDSSTRSTIHSIKPTNVIDKNNLEIHSPIESNREKADYALKRVSPFGSTSNIPNPKNPSRKITPHEKNLKGKDPNGRAAGKRLVSTHEGPDATKTGLRKSSNQSSNIEEAQKALLPSLSPRLKINSTDHQEMSVNKANNRQQKSSSNTNSTENSVSGFRKNSQRAPSTGKGTSQKNDNTLGIERNYMHSLTKDKVRQNSCYPSITQSSNLSALSKSSSRLGGKLPSIGQQTTLMAQENSNDLDSLRRQNISQDTASNEKLLTTVALNTSKSPHEVTENSLVTVIERHESPIKSKKPVKGGLLVDITGIGCGSNPRATPVGGCNWFSRRSTGETSAIPGPTSCSFTHLDCQKENSRPCESNGQQHFQATIIRTPKSKPKSLGNLTGWFSRGSPRPSGIEGGSFLKSTTNIKTKEKSSPLPPNGQFSQDEVDNLIKRLSAQTPQTPNEKSFNALGGRYYTLNIPSLDRSPSKDEKDRNPIAVCMDLINAASNEPQSSRRERLLQMSRVMVDAVSKSRDAECAAEEAKMAAKRAEVAFLETRRHLVEMTELMKNRKQDI